MNGDARKSEIAAAQNYFAVATRAHEMHQLRQEREARIQIHLDMALAYRISQHIADMLTVS